MRFLIAAPPKTGNVWLEQLFSSAFGLHWVREAPAYDYWGDRDPSPLRDSVLAGQYPDSAICHQHFWPCESIRGIARVHDIGLISTLRNPYDQFVSWYFYIQNFAGAFRLKDDPGRRAIGKPIDHPDVLELLTTEFGAFLDQGIAWLDSGLSFIVRYESLHHEPGRVLLAAQQRFGLRLVMSIDRAVADSHRDRMRERGVDFRRHIHIGCAGAWPRHLTGPTWMSSAGTIRSGWPGSAMRQNDRRSTARYSLCL